MKRSQSVLTRVLLTSVLTAGATVAAGTDSTERTDLKAGYSNSPATLHYAGANLRGRPPYTRGTTSQYQMEKGRFARFEELPGDTGDVTRSMSRKIDVTPPNNRPPFKREMISRQQMEKGQFARFEQKTGVVEDTENPINPRLPGNRPPFRRY